MYLFICSFIFTLLRPLRLCPNLNMSSRAGTHGVYHHKVRLLTDQYQAVVAQAEREYRDALAALKNMHEARLQALQVQNSPHHHYHHYPFTHTEFVEVV